MLQLVAVAGFSAAYGCALRIAYILTTLGIGGAEKQVVSLAERMSAKGHTVTLVVLKHETAEEWPVKLPVMRLNMSKTPGGILRGLQFTRRFLEIFRADIIHSHTFPANVFARLLRLMGTKAVSINTIHNVFEGGWHRMLLYWITDPFADHVTAVSTAAMERFTRVRAVSTKKISLLTNGVDTAAFTADRSRRRKMRRQMSAGLGFVWLAVGRIAPAKDYPNLLHAFASVRETMPDVELWIAGEGDFAEMEKANALEAQIDGDGETGVRFLGMRRDIADLLDAADGFVMSSAWEGMPLAIGEAMAMEKPVVATDVGGVRQLVGDAGSIVPARDGESLAEAMLAMMNRSAFERALLGKQARKRIELLYSIDAKAAEWEESYCKWLL